MCGQVATHLHEDNFAVALDGPLKTLCVLALVYMCRYCRDIADEKEVDISMSVNTSPTTDQI